MSKSRKGKKASKKLAIEQLKALINKKFEECPQDLRKKLFLDLEKWGQELGENGELFRLALYSAENTQETQMLIALDEGLKRIRGEQ